MAGDVAENDESGKRSDKEIEAGRKSSSDRIQRFQEKLGRQSLRNESQIDKDLDIRYRNDSVPYFSQSGGAAPYAPPINAPALAADGAQVESGVSGGVANEGLSLGVPVRATGLASLDVALPVRGVEYMFKTPRGDIQISARSVDQDFVSRMNRLAAVTIAFVLIGLCIRLLRRVNYDRVFGRLTCVFMFVAGVLLLFFIAPAIPLILIAGSVVQFVRLSLAKPPQPVEAHA